MGSRWLHSPAKEPSTQGHSSVRCRGCLAPMQWGFRVGAAVRAARASDGSAPAETQPAGSGPGQFRAAWSGVQFRNLTPFGIANSTIYRGAGPAALDGLDYASAFAEVKLLGSAALTDPAKLATFQFWSLAAGTAQPPGAWIQVALAVTKKNRSRCPRWLACSRLSAWPCPTPWRRRSGASSPSGSGARRRPSAKPIATGMLSPIPTRPGRRAQGASAGIPSTGRVTASSAAPALPHWQAFSAAMRCHSA